MQKGMEIERGLTGWAGLATKILLVFFQKMAEK